MTASSDQGARLAQAGLTADLIRSRSDLEPVARLAAIAGIFGLILVINAAAFSFLTVLAGGVLGGFLLVCLFSAFHDTVHLSLFKARTSNVLLGRVIAPLVLLPYEAYRAYHLDHHRFAGESTDPEGRQTLSTPGELAAAIVVPGFFIAFHKDAASALTGQAGAGWPARLDRRILGIEYAFLAIWVCLVLAACALAPRLGAPVLAAYLFYPLWFALTALPEHHECDEVGEPFASTRSLRSNALFRFLYFNGNLHAEHHLHPRLPSRFLWKVHGVMRPELKHYSPGYLDYYRTLSRKLRRSG